MTTKEYLIDTRKKILRLEFELGDIESAKEKIWRKVKAPVVRYNKNDASRGSMRVDGGEVQDIACELSDLEWCAEKILDEIRKLKAEVYKVSRQTVIEKTGKYSERQAEWTEMLGEYYAGTSAKNVCEKLMIAVSTFYNVHKKMFS